MSGGVDRPPPNPFKVGDRIGQIGFMEQEHDLIGTVQKIDDEHPDDYIYVLPDRDNHYWDDFFDKPNTLGWKVDVVDMPIFLEEEYRLIKATRTV